VQLAERHTVLFSVSRASEIDDRVAQALINLISSDGTAKAAIARNS
jgi:hypothetical protein